MTPKKDSFRLVILGAWNPSIFNKDWIFDNLVEDKTSAFTLEFPLDDPTAPRKLGFQGINLFPGRKQLIVSPQDSSLEGIRKCADILQKIFSLLIHTPIGHCGINFNFIEKDNLTKLIEVFDLSDKSELDPENHKLEITRIIRRFLLSDGHILNLMLADSGSEVEIEFNFHYELSDLNKYVELLTSRHISERHQAALDFCQETYGLELEEVTENDR